MITALFLWWQHLFYRVRQNSVDTIFSNNYENTNLNRVCIYSIGMRTCQCATFLFEGEYPQCWISIYFNDLTRQLSDIKPMRIVLWCHKMLRRLQQSTAGYSRGTVLLNMKKSVRNLNAAVHTTTEPYSRQARAVLDYKKFGWLTNNQFPNLCRNFSISLWILKKYLYFWGAQDYNLDTSVWTCAWQEWMACM